MAIKVITDAEQTISDQWVNIARHMRNLKRGIDKGITDITEIQANSEFISNGSAKQKTKMQNLKDYLMGINIPSRFMDKDAD
jgi:hypothetical protein